MDLLLKSVKIIDPNSKHHLKTADILIQRGKIQKISKNVQVPSGIKTIDGKNIHVSPGWFDMRVNFMDPGFEFKEDIDSGLNAAAQGGFTGVLTMPSTYPVVENKSSIEYIKQRALGNIVDVLSAGALSVGMKGEEITEMYDMTRAGAVAFTDDKSVVSDASLMLRALMYCDDLPAIIIAHPEDCSLAKGGMINEGHVSAETGLKGIPDIAESLMLQRDLDLCEYVGTGIHFSGISTSKGIELIKKAKKNNKEISADVAAHQIFLNDKVLQGFDSNYKVSPPLRSEKDRQALIKGLTAGNINVICSDHTPQDKESKDVEFDYAEAGMISCESFFGVVHTVLRDTMELSDIISCFCQNPRSILGIDTPQIEVGVEANLTIFNPKENWEFSKDHIRSKSVNTPFIGEKFIGKAIAVINNNKLTVCK